MMKKTTLIAACCVAAGWLAFQSCWMLTSSSAWAQDKKSKAAPKTAKGKKPGSTTALDQKATEIQTDFIKSAEELANNYYDAGDYDKARTLLKSIQALNPEHPNLETMLKRLDEEAIVSNEVEVEVNSHDGWEPTGIIVTEGKPIRLKAEGNYKLAIAGTLGPAGVPAAKTPADYAGDLPLGSLVGIVMSTESTPRDEKDKDKKKDRPFFVGDGCDYTPTKNGPLFLRINSPENKNTGKLKVQVSGNLKKLK